MRFYVFNLQSARSCSHRRHDRETQDSAQPVVTQELGQFSDFELSSGLSDTKPMPDTE
jgi:hypothetical protein